MGAQAPETASSHSTVQFIVLLPEDATLVVDGKIRPGTGDRRAITLDSNREEGEFAFQASWKELRRPRRTIQKVKARSGQQIEVDLHGTIPTSEELAVLDLVNKERAKKGLEPLIMNAKLLRAARGHSANMARLKMIGHTLEGKTLADRLADTHYGHGEAGENCAAGLRLPAEAVKGWMDSRGHRENILNPRYEQTGVGMATGERGVRFWTQVFAVPAGSSPGRPASRWSRFRLR